MDSLFVVAGIINCTYYSTLFSTSRGMYSQLLSTVQMMSIVRFYIIYTVVRSWLFIALPAENNLLVIEKLS